MTHVVVRQGVLLTSEENKSRTQFPRISPRESGVNAEERDGDRDTPEGCAFVVRPWARDAEPFCGESVIPGSSYCARHHALCVLNSETAAGRAIAAALVAEAEAPEPPQELAHLLPPAIPESETEERPDEFRSLLDHPPSAPGTDLPE